MPREKVTSMSQSVIDKSARLYAQENIRVVHKRSAKTASFDPTNRVMTLPMWVGMTQHLYDMESIHETGHALDTPADGWNQVLARQAADPVKLRGLSSYVNIVEDARIERRQKARFPGSRIDFYEGYRWLWDGGFFELDKNPQYVLGGLAGLNLIDRINIHYKCGPFVDVPFSVAERKWLAEIDDAQTFEQVEKISERLLKLAQNEPSLGASDIHGGTGGGGEPAEEGDEQESGSGGTNQKKPSDTEPKTGARGAGGGPDDHLPKTQDALDQGVSKKLTEKTGGDPIYIEVDTALRVCDAVVGYKDFVATVSKESGIAGADVEIKRAYDQFVAKNRTAVAYMVKDFEIKKAAEANQRSFTSKTGLLDVDRLHAYRTSDDLFKRSSHVPNSKSHALSMFIDFSSSMKDNMRGSVQQMLNLVMFCRRVNIPHRVYTFTDYGSTVDRRRAAKDGVVRSNVFGTRFIELFHERMTAREFAYVAGVLSSTYGGGTLPTPSLLGQSGTPLNEAIVLSMCSVRELREETSAQVVSVVFLTDGEGQQIKTVPVVGVRSSDKITWRDGRTRVERMQLAGEKNGTPALLRLCRDTMGVRVVNFRIETNLDLVDGAVKRANGPKSVGNSYDLGEMDGYSRYLVVRGGSGLDVKNTVDQLNAGKDPSEAGRSRAESRIVLSKFVDMIT